MHVLRLTLLPCVWSMHVIIRSRRFEYTHERLSDYVLAGAVAGVDHNQFWAATGKALFYAFTK